MASQTPQGAGRFKRWRFIVDAKMQYSVLYLVIGVSALTAFTFVAAAIALPAADSSASLTPSEMSSLLLQLGAVYVFFSVASLAWITIRLTHRVAGPAQVLERALRAMTQGDFGQRTKLRAKDYLQDLSQAVGEHAAHLRARREERLAMYDELQQYIASQRPGKVGAVLERLRSLDAVAPALPKDEQDSPVAALPSGELEMSQPSGPDSLQS
ncbi:MAG: hypothetical protein JNJ88_10015 [Planctomycetes bacterium]|nr:hypothetical protein [Planctomycetota bacterium]